MNNDQMDALEYCEQRCLEHTEAIAELEDALEILRENIEEAVELFEGLAGTCPKYISACREGD